MISCALVFFPNFALIPVIFIFVHCFVVPTHVILFHNSYIFLANKAMTHITDRSDKIQLFPLFLKNSPFVCNFSFFGTGRHHIKLNFSFLKYSYSNYFSFATQIASFALVLKRTNIYSLTTAINLTTSTRG